MDNAPVGERGWLGNPYALSDGYSREESVELFSELFHSRLRADREFREAVHDLAGSVLGCWCRSLDVGAPACHGDVIADYLNSPDEWVCREVDHVES